MILMIDNYDSFTYNLVQYLRQLGEEVIVRRNDSISIDDIQEIEPGLIVISPGPGTPDKAGISMEIVAEFQGRMPILGICLGQQVIASVFGGKIKKAIRPVHGKVHAVNHVGKGVFAGLPNLLNVTRYHSLLVDKETLPDCLEITAWTDEGEIMGLLHKQYLIEGLQFHPEAFLTEKGLEMLENFLCRAKDISRTGKELLNDY